MAVPDVDSPRPARDWFASLQRMARIRRWLVAALAGGVVGVVAGLVLDWPFALLVAVSIVAGLLVWDSRYGTLAGFWPITRGSHRLAATATRLERHGWHVFGLPDEALRNGYLVIGSGGIFVVQHEVAPVSVIRRSGLLHVGGRPAIRRVEPLRQTTVAVEAALSGTPADDRAVHAVLALEHDAVDAPHLVAGVTIVSVAGLARHLRRDGGMLGEAEAAAVVAHARSLTTDRPAAG